MGPHPFLLLFSLSCLLTSTIVRSRSLQWTVFLLILTTNTYLAFSTTGDVVSDYFIGSVLVSGVLTVADYALVTDIHRDFRLVGQKGAIPDTAPLSERFKWGFRLFMAPRGIGWAHEPQGIFRSRAALDTPKSSFLLRQVAMMGYYVLLSDIASIYNRTSPVLRAGGPPINSRPLPWRCIDIYSFAVTQFAQQSLLQCFISIVSVSANYSSPHDWVGPFGYWGDAYTLRRFWGRTWHQFLRRPFSTQGKFIAKTLGLRKGTNASAYVQLYTAFFLSAILHTISDYMMHRRLTKSGSPLFFALQPVAITLEDFVLFFAWKTRMDVRPTMWWKLLGYIWVSAWFLCVYSPWLSPMVEGGLMDKALNLRVSIILGVWKGQWNQST
ncbi:membrane bound O-acyl transferase family-domain-containing protein [Mycena pura]|uniref:Membrane bound O-acyl transferase family-domain-containing protein n=1 Tax=Mycena pura TaxID=153505 RepID=A0AAD6Y3I6_9AGAR|nr:membrane bound O-acyl transferase family-domain-containing protein [Mycena pura]